LDFTIGNKGVRTLVSESAREEILADLAEARRRGRDGEFERLYVELVEQGLKGNFEEARRIGDLLLSRTAPVEQAEVHRILAWVSYLTHRELRGKLRIEEYEAKPSLHLLKAIEHVSAAIAVRESDADLYQLRAFLALAQTEEPTEFFETAYQAPNALHVMRKKLREHDSMILERARGCMERVQSDVETALRIRPGDPDTLLLRANRHWGRVSPAEFLEAFDQTMFYASGEERARRIQRALEIGKKWEAEFLGPVESDLKELLADHPQHIPAWAHLATAHFLNAYVGLLRGDLEPCDDLIRTTTRCLDLSPEESVVGAVLTFRISARGWKYIRGGDVESRRAGLEDLERFRKFDPEGAKEYEPLFPEPKK